MKYFYTNKETWDCIITKKAVKANLWILVFHEVETQKKK